MSAEILEAALDSGFKASSDHVSAFREKGYVKLKGFLSPAAVEMLRTRVDEELGNAAPNFKDAFRRLKYDFETGKEAVYSLLETPSLQNSIYKIVGKKLFMTFELCFELARNESKGFPWHVGVQSFGYQTAEDFGCTIWAPLHRIDAAGQGGGMAYVPRNIISGRFVYEDIEPAMVSTLERRRARGLPVSMEDYSFLRTGPLNAPAFDMLLQEHAECDDFEPGDILLFDKYVVHKSVMLGDGPLERRQAFVMRFVEVGSRYDRTRAENLEYPARTFGHKAFTQSHLHVGERDGDIISDSPFFDSRSRRLIGHAADL